MRHISRQKRIALLPLIFIGVAAVVFLFGWIVMSLWNSVMVAAVGASVITFWQGLGLLVLSRILVGGFGGKGGGFRQRRNWKEKWATMTPEEREKFQNYCSNRRGKDFSNDQQNAAAE